VTHTQEDQDFSVVTATAQLITHTSSESRIVDLTNNGMVNHYIHTPYRKTTNSNDNQVCLTFYRTQWKCILFVCYKLRVTTFILIQTSHSPLTITTETLCLSITGEKYTVSVRQHMVTCSCSPSLRPCWVVRGFETWCSWFRDCFFKNEVRNRKKNWILTRNVVVCPIQLKIGFYKFGKIQLKSSRGGLTLDSVLRRKKQ
jgi:hypothetical protein